MAARRAALAAALLLVAAVGCVTPGAPGAGGASGAPGSAPFFRPGEETPVPEGVVGTADPFLAAHPATSQFVLPTATIPNPAPVKADHVVAAIEPFDGRWRISCLARGKALNGNTLEFRYELLVDRPPPAPASWPVARTADLVPGTARVTHYYGAGTGWVGTSGSLAISRVARGEDAVAFDFSVAARLESASSGPGTPRTSPTPIRGQETPGASGTAPPQRSTGGGNAPEATDGREVPGSPSPPATAPPPPTAAPSPTAPSPSPVAPFQVLQTNLDVMTIRWTGTFYVKPGVLP